MTKLFDVGFGFGRERRAVAESAAALAELSLRALQAPCFTATSQFGSNQRSASPS